ncbi:MAG: hypothetical protein A3K65_05175 [Euryarchaeota archaeon RBG_16_68_12]|nr:MAG: hypothetical protein A3K65_05175 [Euryarchaeota archaeon RBG_16_68_12]
MLAEALGDEERARAWWTATAQRISVAPDVDRAIRELTGSIDRDVGPYAVGVFLENAATRELVLTHTHAKGPLRDHAVSLYPEEGIVGFAHRHGVPLVVHDVARDPRYLRGPLADAASALAVPVRSGEGAVGVLDVEADRPWAFDALDLEGFGALASALGRVLARTPPLPAPPPR